MSGEYVRRGVHLTPPIPPDSAFLYRLMVGTDAGARQWRFKGVTPTFEDFPAAMAQGVFAHFVVREDTQDEPLGYVAAFGANPRDGYCYLGAIFVGEVQRTGVPMIALSLLIDFLFESSPMRKLYVEASESNLPQYSSITEVGFVTEGRLEAHEYQAGRYEDVSILSLHRTEWISRRAAMGLTEPMIHED